VTHPNVHSISGVAASPGISIGRAHVNVKKKITSTGVLLERESDVLAEMNKFRRSVQLSVGELEAVKIDPDKKLKDDEIEILEAHIELLTDPQIEDDVFQKITINRRNAVDAVIEVIHDIAQTFHDMKDEYLSARAADVMDIGERILGNLNVTDDIKQPDIQPNTVIVADDISPSFAITMDLGRVAAMVTRVGGKTSHTAILAKSKGIPAVLGCGDALSNIKDNDLIIVDGSNGVVIVNPDDACIEDYKARITHYEKELTMLHSLKDMAAATTDGIDIVLLANIAHAGDMEDAVANGAMGAGLFRTEWLFMNRSSLPTEEEQFQYYRKVALAAKGRPVIVRTIDVGGDKPIDYLGLPREENSFLGYRAIRFCLDRKDIFLTQLRAILRASAFGDLRIMFPMISGLHELRQAKEILHEAKSSLREDKLAFTEEIKSGIMIEVPSAAIVADVLAKETDFFSIGTNDLCQYTLAVDRMNEKVARLYDPYHPAVLRLVANVIEQGHKHNIQVGMCGELASDPLATLLLVGMGLTEFSMNAGSILHVKNIILSNSFAGAMEVWAQVMTMDNAKSIIEYLQEHK